MLTSMQSDSQIGQKCIDYGNQIHRWGKSVLFIWLGQNITMCLFFIWFIIWLLFNHHLIIHLIIPVMYVFTFINTYF